MDEFIVSESFCKEIKRICIRKFIKLTKKCFKFLSFLMQKQYNLWEISQNNSSKTFKILKKAMMYPFWRERCSVLHLKHSRMTTNESKNFKSSRFYATYVYSLNCFGVRMLDQNRQQKVKILRVFADFWHFLDFNLRLENFGRGKAPDGIPRWSAACISMRIWHFSWKKTSSEWLKRCKNSSFQDFWGVIRMIFEQLLCTRDKKPHQQLNLVSSNLFWRYNCNLLLLFASETHQNMKNDSNARFLTP